MFSNKPPCQTQPQPQIHIITPDFNSDHIEQLVEQLSRRSIPYSLQKEVDTLGQPLDRRYFVVVDNMKGAVVLGAEFSSLLMFVVGFPRKGPNKKNLYCRKVGEVVERYRGFCGLPELEKTTFSTYAIKSKSQLKTIKSIKSIPRSRQSSTVLHNRSQSVSNSIKQIANKIRSLTSVEESPQVFLMRTATKGRDSIEFNKFLSKVAVSDPKKYKIVESFNQLQSCLQTRKNADNSLVVTEEMYTKLSWRDHLNVKVIVFDPRKRQGAGEGKQKYVSSFQEILNELKDPKQVEETANRVRKVRTVNPEDKSKKNVLWANESSESKPTISQVQTENDYYIQTFSKSQNQIGQLEEKQPCKVMLSRTEPGRGNNVFADGQLKQLKALEQIEKEYNMARISQQKGSNRKVNPVKGPQRVSLSQETKGDTTIVSQQVGNYIQNTVNLVSDQMANQIHQDEIRESQNSTLKSDLKAPRTLQKIKRIRSEAKPEKQNPQKLRYNPQILKRRFVLPEQYCSPFSPATVSVGFEQQGSMKSIKSIRTIRRVVRCYSEEPEIRYFFETPQPRVLRSRVYRLLPIHEPNTVMIEEKERAGWRNLENTPFSSSDSRYGKKSEVLLSTNGTETEGNLFIQSKHSQTDSGFPKSDQKSVIYERRESTSDANLQTGKFCQSFSILGTFGNLRPSSNMKVAQNPILERESLVLEQKSPILNRIYNNSLSFHSFPESKISNISSSSSSVNPKCLTRPVSILWKEFNFDIEEALAQVNKKLEVSNVRQHSFCLVSELEKIIKILPCQSKIIVMLDDADLDQYLSALQKICSRDGSEIKQFKGEILAIYMYSKNSSANPYQTHTSSPSLLSFQSPFLQIIKRVQTNDYYDSNKLTARKILELIKNIEVPQNS